MHPPFNWVSHNKFYLSRAKCLQSILITTSQLMIECLTVLETLIGFGSHALKMIGSLVPSKKKTKSKRGKIFILMHPLHNDFQKAINLQKNKEIMKNMVWRVVIEKANQIC